MDTVLYEVGGPVATITLNRPDKLNAINPEMIEGLHAALDAAERDDAVKVVVLTSNGRSFSAGYDIIGEDSAPRTPLEWRPLLARDVDLAMRIWSFGKPTIAAVRGYCLGGACELAMACDMIVAAQDAQFGEPEILYGSGPVALLMPFILGQKKTSELLLTGDRIDADAALRFGLVNHVVELDELKAAVDRLARKIAPTPLVVLQLTKQALLRAYEAQGLRAAVAANLDLSCLINGADTPEQREFDAIARARGLKAALAWRDGRYAG